MECDAVEEPPGDVWQPARPPRGCAAAVSTWGDATALYTHALGPHLGVLGGGALTVGGVWRIQNQPKPC